MKQTVEESDEVLRRLVQWAKQKPSVCAMLLTSSRANPKAIVDRFSDFDVIVVVRDVHPFFEDSAWLADFGTVLAVYRDPIGFEYGLERFRYITQYEDGLKIDFTLWPVDVLQRIAEDTELPDELDVGYRILIDKEHLTRQLKPPAYQAHIPKPPTEVQYQDNLNDFFHEATYVAKHLWRGDLIPAKFSLDYFMKHLKLRQMLEWRMEIDQQWALKPGANGKGLKNVLHPEVWSELENTYVGAGIEENWQALFRTLDLFRRVATEVGEHFRYAYPRETDERVAAYLNKIRSLNQR